MADSEMASAAEAKVAGQAASCFAMASGADCLGLDQGPEDKDWRIEGRRRLERYRRTRRRASDNEAELELEAVGLAEQSLGVAGVSVQAMAASTTAVAEAGRLDGSAQRRSEHEVGVHHTQLALGRE